MKDIRIILDTGMGYKDLELGRTVNITIEKQGGDEVVKTETEIGI